jgi:hypothetical protein
MGEFNFLEPRNFDPLNPQEQMRFLTKLSKKIDEGEISALPPVGDDFGFGCRRRCFVIKNSSEFVWAYQFDKSLMTWVWKIYLKEENQVSNRVSQKSINLFTDIEFSNTIEAENMKHYNIFAYNLSEAVRLGTLRYISNGVALLYNAYLFKHTTTGEFWGLFPPDGPLPPSWRKLDYFDEELFFAGKNKKSGS